MSNGLCFPHVLRYPAGVGVPHEAVSQHPGSSQAKYSESMLLHFGHPHTSSPGSNGCGARSTSSLVPRQLQRLPSHTCRVVMFSPMMFIAPNQLIVVLRPAWPWIAIAMHLAQLLRQQHSRRRADWQDCAVWAGHSEPSLEFLLCFAQGFVAFGWAHVLPSKMYPSSASVLFAICSCR